MASVHGGRIWHSEGIQLNNKKFRRNPIQSRESSRMGSLNFDPIFVVGCQRSGTTALAVMLDRHSSIAVPPETHFFARLNPLPGRSHSLTHAQRIARAMRCTDLGAASLDLAGIAQQYALREATDANLLEVALQSYARQHGARRIGQAD